jgi:hypothetical protein
MCHYLETFPYHIRHLQTLHKWNYVSHLEFTSLVCELMDANKHILITHVLYKLKRSKPKLNIWCGVTCHKVCRSFFFYNCTMMNTMLSSMQDAAPPDWSLETCNFLNEISMHIGVVMEAYCMTSKFTQPQPT